MVETVYKADDDTIWLNHSNAVAHEIREKYRPELSTLMNEEITSSGVFNNVKLIVKLLREYMAEAGIPE